MIFESPEGLEKLYHPTKESLERALRRVYLLDTVAFAGNTLPPRWQSNTHECYEKIVRNRFLEEEEARIAYVKLLLTLRKMREHRTIFVTEGGKLGMAVNTIQPGDIVTLLLGGDLPFVLRRIEDSNHYTYVADCYVRGFMDGEGLEEAREAVDPAWKRGDKTWLEKLRKGKLPFPVEEFHIH